MHWLYAEIAGCDLDCYFIPGSSCRAPVNCSSEQEIFDYVENHPNTSDLAVFERAPSEADYSRAARIAEGYEACRDACNDSDACCNLDSDAMFFRIHVSLRLAVCCFEVILKPDKMQCPKLLASIFRPALDFQAHLSNLESDIGFQGPIVGIHIRHGALCCHNNGGSDCGVCTMQGILI